MIIIAGLGLLILHAVAFLIIYDVVPPLFIKPGSSYQETAALRRNLYLALGLISNTIAAAAFALLLAGVFMQRRTVPADS